MYPSYDLSFLHRYRKGEILRYLAAMHVLPQNSSNVLRLSMMVYEALSVKGGREHLFIPKFQREMERHYNHDVTEDPQEYLFVDAVHTSKGTYRVFPGIFSYLQYNLTRLFELAEVEGIDPQNFSLVYILLEMSDQIAERCGLKRYEKGQKAYDGFYCSNYQERQKLEQVISYKRRELEYLFGKYGASNDQINTLVYRPKRRELKRFEMRLGDYSPIEYSPLYLDEQGNYVVLQPSALLSCAYIRSLDIINQQIGEEKTNRRYLDVMMTEAEMAMKAAGVSNIDGDIVGKTGYLLYRYDVDGLVCVSINHQDTFKDDFKIIEKRLADRYTGANVCYVDVKNALDLHLPVAETHVEHISITIDDFKIMMGQPQMNPTNLYYYQQARQRIRHGLGQEIDMFAFYIGNRQTFYTDQPSALTYYEIGMAYDMRCDYLMKRDEHLVDGPGHLIMVRHFDDYPSQIPIYVPMGSKDVNILVGEYGKSRLTAIVIANNDGETLALREMTKSLVAWTYGFCHRYDEELLMGDIQLFLKFRDGDNPTMRQIDSDIFEYNIPRKVYEVKPKDKTYDHLIFDFFVEALMKFGMTLVDDAHEKVAEMFGECKGELLLIEPKGIEYWAENDGHQATYYVSGNACDKVLDKIANYLKMGGTNRILDLNESKDVTLKVIDYLGTTLNSMLAQYSTEKFVKSLMELHHGTLFWLATTSMRFERVNGVMSYMGANYREQKELLFKYSETNSLVQCLLERIVGNDYYSETDPKLVDIDNIFAYMHELFNFGIYLDILTFKIEGTELGILANGRVGLPHEKIDEQMAYFADLRENELYRPDDYRKLHSIQKKHYIDTNDETFRDAFADEYHLTYEKWRSLLQESLDYAYGNGVPIIDMPWKEFENSILLKVLDENEIEMFKATFCLNKEMKDGAKYSESFAQRFNRRNQISSRPWIFHRGKVLFSTKSLHQHEYVVHDRLNDGKVHAASPKMKAFMGELNRRKGSEFEQSLQSFYESLCMEELKVFRGVMIGPEEKLMSEIKLGDVDVLLINTLLKRIVCIEAKDYVESRTIYDMLSQNRRTEDDMEMPLKRDAWCKKNVKAFSNLCPEVDDSYVVSTVFVTFNMPAYCYYHQGNDRQLQMIPALDIVKNPMVVFR